MWQKRAAAEPVVVVRYTVDPPLWSWALVVRVPTVQGYPDAQPKIGRVRRFDFPPDREPTVREAVAALLRQEGAPA